MMNVHIEIHPQMPSRFRKRLFRRDEFQRIAQTLCFQKGLEGEIEVSVLLCDDATIRTLNHQYRHVNEPTDVLSFCQDTIGSSGFTALGDIAISLDTVERHCLEQCALEGEKLYNAMRKDVRLLFCHGVLHLLGYDHATEAGRKEMQERQAGVLGILEQDAWIEPAENTARK